MLQPFNCIFIWKKLQVTWISTTSSDIFWHSSVIETWTFLRWYSLLIISSQKSLWNPFGITRWCFIMYNINWRCLWCNGYRRRNWTRWYEFKSWTRLIAFHIVLIPLGKVWIQLFSLQLWVNSRTDWVLQPWWGN